MMALILGSASPSATDDLIRPVAGAPLLIRQIEWLQQAGVDHVVINRVSQGPLPVKLRSAELIATGVRVTWIPTADPLDERALARRAGHDGSPVVVLCHATLGDADLGALMQTVRDTGSSICLARDRGCVRVFADDAFAPATETPPPSGWLCAVDDEGCAQSLTEQLLLGERGGVVIRGTEVSPGIWRGRGAVVVEGVTLRAPCLLGPHCFVAEDATLGPGAVIGEHAVVEAAASISHARVDDGVIVGQGLQVANACVREGTIVRHGGRAIAIDDPLLVGHGQSASRLPRLLAALAVGPVAPVAALAGGRAQTLCRRLSRVVEGRGRWVGVRQESDADDVLIDVMPMLVPPRALDEERRAATAFYDAKKSYLLDAKLLLGRVVGGGSPAESEE